MAPTPSKRPRSSYIRLEAEQPNETWQSDFTHYRLTRPDGRPGPDAEIMTRPKATPAPTAPTTPTTASATTRSAKPARSPCVAGRPRHIGIDIGKTYAGTYVILLAQDLNVRIIDATTGDLLRDLVSRV